MNLAHPFAYELVPRIRLIVHSVTTGQTDDIEAMIDTGAEVTLLDTNVATALGIDLLAADSFRINVVGGHFFDAKVAPLRLSLLQLPELTLDLNIIFAAGIAESSGNLIGLDVLSHFDFALQHSQRTGYLGVTSTQ